MSLIELLRGAPRHRTLLAIAETPRLRPGDRSGAAL